MMFDKANRPLSCANHSAGFTSHTGGIRIPTRLILKVESGGCYGRDDGSAFCCMLRSREEYCTYWRHYAVSYPRGSTVCWGINYQTHAQTHTHTHTHTILCAHYTFPIRTYNLCNRPRACCLFPLSSSHLHSQLLCHLYVLVFGC